MFDVDCQLIELLLLGESQTAEREQDSGHQLPPHRRPPETDRSQAGGRPHQSLLPCGAGRPAESVPGVSAAADEDVPARHDVSDVVTAPASSASTSTVAETV